MSFDFASIEYITEEGESILTQSPTLRERIQIFLEAAMPENMIGGKFVGTGNYSTVREIDDVAVKVSSPTSSRKWRETGESVPPENLIIQFVYLQRLRAFLIDQSANIFVPQQYFALYSPYYSYLLCQEYMRGWIDLNKVFGPDENDKFAAATFHIIKRVEDVMSGSLLRYGLHDLYNDAYSINGGNILVPEGVEPYPGMPFCIIDQPRIHLTWEMASVLGGW